MKIQHPGNIRHYQLSIVPFQLITSFADSNLLISFAALAATYQTYILLNIPVRVEPLGLLVFFSTLMVYHFHRIMAISSTAMEHLSRTQLWYVNNKKLALILLAISVMIIAISLAGLPLRTRLALLPLVAIAGFYTVPLFFFKHKSYRLRDLGLVKPFIIGLAWAGVTALLPVINFEVDISWSETVLLFFERFFFISALCIPFDVKDIQIDSEKLRTQTIAAKWGVWKTIVFSMFVLALFAATIVLEWVIGADWVGMKLLLGFLASFVVTAAAIMGVSEKRGEHYYTVIIDGTIILQALIITVCLLT